MSEMGEGHSEGVGDVSRTSEVEEKDLVEEALGIYDELNAERQAVQDFDSRYLEEVGTGLVEVGIQVERNSSAEDLVLGGQEILRQIEEEMEGGPYDPEGFRQEMRSSLEELREKKDDETRNSTIEMFTGLVRGVKGWRENVGVRRQDVARNAGALEADSEMSDEEKHRIEARMHADKVSVLNEENDKSDRRFLDGNDERLGEFVEIVDRMVSSNGE